MCHYIIHVFGDTNTKYLPNISSTISGSRQLTPLACDSVSLEKAPAASRTAIMEGVFALLTWFLFSASKTSLPFPGKKSMNRVNNVGGREISKTKMN